MEENPYIEFKNGQAPYVSDANLNQMQKLIKADIKQQILDVSNDVQEIQNDVQEKTSQKELWTNPSPTSAFASKTITLNESDFDYLIIFLYRNTSISIDTETMSTLVEKNKRTYAIFADYIESSPRIWNRLITVNNNKVTFAEATINGSTNNNTLVPYKILGCKY